MKWLDSVKKSIGGSVSETPTIDASESVEASSRSKPRLRTRNVQCREVGVAIDEFNAAHSLFKNSIHDRTRDVLELKKERRQLSESRSILEGYF